MRPPLTLILAALVVGWALSVDANATTLTHGVATGLQFSKPARTGAPETPPAAKPNPAKLDLAKPIQVKEDGRLKLPPGGVPIPESAKMIRDKYDKNKDGQLTQDELDAMPDEIRAQVEKSLRVRLDQAVKLRGPINAESSTNTEPAPLLREVTYTRDVAPILFKNCVECHRPGEVAPFALLTYDDAKRRARHIVEVTASRRMPPWHGEPGPFKFLDERRLTDTELRILARWTETGAKEGDPKHMPAVPTFPEGFRLGKPDILLKLPKPFVIPADGPDLHEVFVVAVPLKEGRWIKGFEFQPDNRRVVHHCTTYLNPSGDAINWIKDPAMIAKLKNSRDLLPLLAGKDEMLPFGTWNPGHRERFLPEGGWVWLAPGSAVLMVVHYHPIGKEQIDNSSLCIYLADTPRTRMMGSVMMAIRDGTAKYLDVPAGEANHTVTLSRKLPVGAAIQRIHVHGHFLLRHATVTAVLPNGNRVRLMKIKDRDFNWQERFDFAEPPWLPAETVIEMVGVFDNSADNFQNPNKPPKDMHFGPSSTDEMFGAIVHMELDKNQPLPARPEVRVPSEGVPIPESETEFRTRYDKNKDGLLNPEEYQALPEALRKKMDVLIRRRYGDSLERVYAGLPPGHPDAPAKAPAPQEQTPPNMGSRRE